LREQPNLTDETGGAGKRSFNVQTRITEPSTHTHTHTHTQTDTDRHTDTHTQTHKRCSHTLTRRSLARLDRKKN
jgi:hypothetical protein